MRSSWKCLYGKNLDIKKLRFYKRNIPIQKVLLGKLVEVHNGSRFVSFRIRKEQFGLYLGEFAHPTKKVIHKKKVNKKKK